MEQEYKPNIIEKPNFQNLIINEIDKILTSAINIENKKEYLTKTLSNNYGEELAQKIVNVLPEDTFHNQTSPITKETKEAQNNIIEQEPKDIFKQEITKIYTRLETFPEEQRQKRFEEILEKEYGITPNKIRELKKGKNWKKIFNIGSFTAPIAILALMAIFKPFNLDKNIKQDKKDTTLKNKTEISNTNKEQELRFKKEIYESISEKGKEVYKYMAEENPTPNRGYQFLDKDSGKIYIFDKNNFLINKINAGYGIDTGDDPNTSFEYNKGKMTTPAGIYLLSNYSSPEDIEEYGKLQFSLYGQSVLGDKIFLGEHQTYNKHGEFESRTSKLQSPTPDDNRFSNGCININRSDFEQYVKPYFKGDYGEFFFVLPDEKSRESEVKFDTKVLIQKIKPMIIEMANTEGKIYNETINQVAPEINEIIKEMKILWNKQLKLVDEHKRNKSDNSKQIQIENIKKEIKSMKSVLSKKREIFNRASKKLEEIKIKINGVNSLT